MAPKPGKVLALKGDAHVYQAGTSLSKAHITTLLAASASGHYIPLMIVYPGVQPHNQLREDFHNWFPQGLFGNSQSGLMDSELFVAWLKNGFIESVKQRGVWKPILLLIDSAKCHLSIQASEICNENEILLYMLFCNATHLIQVLDLVLMNAVKTIYKEEVRTWLMKNPGELFDNYSFIDEFVPMWNWALKIENAIKGFEKSGIFSWNPQAVKTGKLAPASIYQKPDPMLVINNSFVEPVEGDVPVVKSAEPQPSTSAEGQIPRNNSNKANEAEVKVKRFGEELLWLTLGGKKYKLIEVADDGPELQKKDVVEDILKVLQAKVSHMGGAQMQGLPRCISNKKYWEILKAKEDKKMKEKEEVEKWKEEQAAKAEQKRIAKKVAKDKRTVNHKCHQTKIIELSSSSDETEEEMVLDDESSTDESGKESDVFLQRHS